jgi:hypothetical protein
MCFTASGKQVWSFSMSDAPTMTVPDDAPEAVERAAKTRKWSHITVHATPDFHHEYKLFALENGLTMQQLMMESFALFKSHLKGQGRRRAG